MESLGAPSSQNDLEKEVQNWEIHISEFQNLLQSYSNPNSVVLALRTDI